jgi:hypothetical protein
MNPQAGYSGTPLWKKLGLADGVPACVIDPPFDYAAALAPLPIAPRWQAAVDADTRFAHLFAVDAEPLAGQLAVLRGQMDPAAMLWVSWPKKAARMPSSLRVVGIRAIALPLGWVDVKVCAVNATWSGLKLVVRKALR